jgi:Domain of unknown function DUF11
LSIQTDAAWSRDDRFSCSGTTTVTCSLGQLAAGATSTVSLTLKAIGTGSQTNTATISAIPLDPNVKNNSASVVTAVTEDPPVNLTPPTISGGHQVGDELTVNPERGRTTRISTGAGSFPERTATAAEMTTP